MAAAMIRSNAKYSIFDEDTASHVYSPVPKKYLRKSSLKSFGMALRSRIPLKQLNSTSSFMQLKSGKGTSSPTKYRRAMPHSEQTMNGNVNKKIKRVQDRKLNRTAKQTKENRQVKKAVSPTSWYRSPRKNAPLTPVNPLDEVSPHRRRSKRLSGWSVGSPNLTPKPTTGRKRTYMPDKFNEHLEMVASGIQTLQANCKQLDTAIHKTYQSPPASKRLRTVDGSVTRTQAGYQARDEASLPIRGSALRRTMSKVAARSRTICTKFAQSASSLESQAQQRRGYRQVTSVGDLRGCPNNAVEERS